MKKQRRPSWRPFPWVSKLNLLASFFVLPASIWCWQSSKSCWSYISCCNGEKICIFLHPSLSNLITFIQFSSCVFDRKIWSTWGGGWTGEVPGTWSCSCLYHRPGLSSCPSEVFIPITQNMWHCKDLEEWVPIKGYEDYSACHRMEIIIRLREDDSVL